VFDAAGKKVLTQDITNPNGNSFNIKTTLNPGLYLVQVSHNNQQAFVKVTVW
jgi:hypothetical protein